MGRTELRAASRLIHGHGEEPVADTLDGVSVHPDPPHVNMFRVLLDLEVDAALEARDRVADQLRLWAFGQATAADEPNRCWAEIYVGEAAAAVSDADVADAFRSLMTEA